MEDLREEDREKREVQQLLLADNSLQKVGVSSSSSSSSRRRGRKSRDTEDGAARRLQCSDDAGSDPRAESSE